MRISTYSLVGMLGIVMVVGCSDRPRAPALTRDAIFQDDGSGLRFAAPDGWIMTLRGVPPAGKLEKHTRLVRYQPQVPDRHADFELAVIDLSQETDITEYLNKHQAGGQKWVPTGPPEQLSIGDSPATRHEFSSGKRAGFKREITVVRRGERVYLFQTTYSPNDASSRDQARVAIQSVVWKN